MKTYNKAGFSLIELLVALSILAVVAAIIVPRFLNVRANAAATTAQAQQRLVEHTIQQFCALGGTISGSKTGDILDFLAQSSTGSARSGTGLSDSTGTFGSTTIGLQVASGTGAGQFSYQTGKDATYNDGAGNSYTVSYNSATQKVSFTGLSANGSASGSNIN